MDFKRNIFEKPPDHKLLIFKEKCYKDFLTKTHGIFKETSSLDLLANIFGFLKENSQRTTWAKILDFWRKYL